MPLKTLTCATCLEEKPRELMVISSKGRAIRWCLECKSKGIKRCSTCGEVREVPRFPASPGTYQDGSRQLGTRCYICQGQSISRDSIDKKARLYKERTLLGAIRRNLRSWRARSRDKDLPKCDLTVDYCLALFQQQNGRCYYTGLPLVLEKGKRLENQMALSLDRKDPAKGYVKRKCGLGRVLDQHYEVESNRGRLHPGVPPNLSAIFRLR